MSVIKGLRKTQDGQWKVRWDAKKEYRHMHFPSIEEASEIMVDRGVDDDSIDEAIITIHIADDPCGVEAVFENGVFSKLEYVR